MTGTTPPKYTLTPDMLQWLVSQGIGVLIALVLLLMGTSELSKVRDGLDGVRQEVAALRQDIRLTALGRLTPGGQ